MQAIREQMLKSTGYVPIAGPCTARYGDMELGTILAAVEYGYQLDCKERAAEARRLRKKHKRKLMRKAKQ